MRRIYFTATLVLAAFSFLNANIAGATTITSTTYNAWKASLTGSPSEADFGSIQYTGYNTSSGLTLNSLSNSSLGFTVTGPDGAGWMLNGTTYTGFKSLESSADAGATMMITMPIGGENAFLLSLASIGSTPMTVTLSDAETFTVNNGLLGLSISHPITYLTISTQAGSQVVMDDLWYGLSSLTQDSTTTPTPSTTTPEGSTLLLMAGGALVLFGIQRRFRPALNCGTAA